MKVRAKNLGIISEVEVEFKKGLNIIVGSSSSGKSTLLRGIKNLIDNSFSDSCISSDKTSMYVLLENNNHKVEYVRDLNNQSRKSLYTVDGTQYTKVGRLPLQQVYDALNIRSFEIDGTNVYFNMSLQFSAPFLVLESKSFLYSVLTYRSSFDITKINDLYNTDLKESKKTISVKETEENILESSIMSSKQKLLLLSDVPSLHNKFLSLKNKYNDLTLLNSYIKKYENSSESISRSEESIRRISEYISIYNRILEIISSYKIISKYVSIKESVEYSNSIIESANRYVKAFNVLEEKYTVIRKIHNLIFLEKKISIGYNLISMFDELSEKSKCIISIMKFIGLHKSYNDTLENNEKICSEISSINEKLNYISRCPLCGQSMLSHN